MFPKLLAAACVLILLCSCSRGEPVPVPADFPLQFTLPAGSEITDRNSLDEGTLEKTEAVDSLDFTCRARDTEVIRHITEELAALGYARQDDDEDLEAGLVGGLYTRPSSDLRVSIGGSAGQYFLLVSTLRDAAVDDSAL